MEVVKLKCPECNANLEMDDSNGDYIICAYCGTKVLFKDESKTKVEKVMKKANGYIKKVNNYHNSEEYKIKKKIREDKNRKSLITTFSIFGIFFLLIILILVIVPPENPSLEKYNSLSLGMTYNECKEILGTDGHLVYEEGGNTKYVWYDNSCADNEECNIIIELNFENDSLISRTENGLE